MKVKIILKSISQWEESSTVLLPVGDISFILNSWIGDWIDNGNNGNINS